MFFLDLEGYCFSFLNVSEDLSWNEKYKSENVGEMGVRMAQPP